MTKTCTVISAAFLVLSCGQIGCSRSDDAKDAVNESAHIFETVSVGDASTSTGAAESYAKIEALSAKYAGSENGYSEAAALGVANAKIGQAALASQEAAQGERDALHQGRVIRGHINEWLTMNAIAQAAGAFSPTEELKELSGLISLRQDDVAGYSTQRDEIQAQIAELESKIQSLQAKAKTERDAGATIELQIPDVSATQGVSLAERVREHTLRGDQFGLEAVRIQGRVDDLRPRSEEITLNVNKAAAQIELLDQAREELHERERANMSDAAEARAKAKAASDSIRRLATELESFRASDVETKNARAISLARGAISATRDANDAVASVAALTKASALQILGDCQARKAHGHAEAAMIYDAIAQAGVSGQWTAMGEGEREAQTAAHEEALQSYQGAASALRSARIRGEAGEKLEAAALRLDSLGGVEPEPEEVYEDESYDEDMPEEEMDEQDDESADEPIEDDG